MPQDEINRQEWDETDFKPADPKVKIELALIDLYHRLEMHVPKNHQEILDQLAEKLLPKNSKDYMYNWIRERSGKP